MKIQIGSDLHREFVRDWFSKNSRTRLYDPSVPQNENMTNPLDRAGEYGIGLRFFFDKVENVDILVLAGDIEYMRRFEDMDTLFREGLELARHVVYVPGNHDFYRSRICKIQELKEKYTNSKNIHILYNTSIDIEGVKIFGGTQWGNLNPANEMTYRYSLNDFRKIKMFSPTDMIREHLKFRNALEKMLPDVVVSHFLPCTKSIPARFAHDAIMNDYYCTDMTPYFYNVKLWIHGHTHDACDYNVGDTRVVCNPHGYFGYENIVFDRKFVVEI